MKTLKLCGACHSTLFEIEFPCLEKQGDTAGDQAESVRQPVSKDNVFLQIECKC